MAVKVLDLRPPARKPTTPRACPLQRKRRIAVEVSRRLRAAEKEAKILKSLTGAQHVLRFAEFFVEEGFSYMVTEKCDLDLLQYLEGLPLLSEKSLAPVLRQMLRGIAAAHKAGVVHRDVKPDNFMCQNGAVKLCDFGLACEVSSADKFEISGIVGTPAFMAPEIIAGEPYSGHVDLWSFGVLVYTLFFGRYPYLPEQQTGPAMLAAVRAGVPAPSFQPFTECAEQCAPISHQARRFVKRLLCRKPGWRPSAAKAMCNRFFAAAESQQQPCSLRPMLKSAMRLRACRADGYFSAAAESQPQSCSLRPMLQSAMRIGAFNTGGCQRHKSYVDTRLAQLQERHCPSANPSSSWVSSQE